MSFRPFLKHKRLTKGRQMNTVLSPAQQSLISTTHDEPISKLPNPPISTSDPLANGQDLTLAESSNIGTTINSNSSSLSSSQTTPSNSSLDNDEQDWAILSTLDPKISEQFANYEKEYQQFWSTSAIPPIPIHASPNSQVPNPPYPTKDLTPPSQSQNQSRFFSWPFSKAPASAKNSSTSPKPNEVSLAQERLINDLQINKTSTQPSSSPSLPNAINTNPSLQSLVKKTDNAMPFQRAAHYVESQTYKNSLQVAASIQTFLETYQTQDIEKAKKESKNLQSATLEQIGLLQQMCMSLFCEHLFISKLRENIGNQIQKLNELFEQREKWLNNNNQANYTSSTPKLNLPGINLTLPSLVTRAVGKLYQTIELQAQATRWHEELNNLKQNTYFQSERNYQTMIDRFIAGYGNEEVEKLRRLTEETDQILQFIEKPEESLLIEYQKHEQFADKYLSNYLKIIKDALAAAKRSMDNLLANYDQLIKGIEDPLIPHNSELQAWQSNANKKAFGIMKEFATLIARIENHNLSIWESSDIPNKISLKYQLALLQEWNRFDKQEFKKLNNAMEALNKQHESLITSFQEKVQDCKTQIYTLQKLLTDLKNLEKFNLDWDLLES